MKNWAIRSACLAAMGIALAGSLSAQSDKDKTSADQAMKAINSLIGGDAISAKDSAAIIANYKNATGGSGVHYESQTTSTSSRTGTRKDTMRIYFASSGEGRVEMTMPVPGAAANPMIILGRAKSPGSSIILYPVSKTYALQRIDTSLLRGNANYQISKVGNETVQGYPCIHARMVSVYGSGSFKVTTTTDLWTSTSVPGYSTYSKMLHLQPTQIGMMAALDKAGCMGYIVKMQTTSANHSMVSVLVKAEEGRFSPDLFRIPSGYAQSDENMFQHMMPAAKKP
jgi:Domain of unknown function (DUF4412)